MRFLVASLMFAAAVAFTNTADANGFGLFNRQRVVVRQQVVVQKVVQQQVVQKVVAVPHVQQIVVPVVQAQVYSQAVCQPVVQSFSQSYAAPIVLQQSTGCVQFFRAH